jgi:hypothetical protein
MTAESIAKALGGRKAGVSWIATCPAHDDREPSLSIRDADDGKVLVRCHAGCVQERVIASLRSRGLWTESGPRRFMHSALVLSPASRIATTPNAAKPRSPFGTLQSLPTARWSRPISALAACSCRHPYDPSFQFPNRLPLAIQPPQPTGLRLIAEPQGHRFDHLPSSLTTRVQYPAMSCQ